MNILYEIKKTKLKTIRITNLRFHKFQSVIYVTNIPEIKRSCYTEIDLNYVETFALSNICYKNL